MVRSTAHFIFDNGPRDEWTKAEDVHGAKDDGSF
jgi:hypothetical protein